MNKFIFIDVERNKFQFEQDNIYSMATVRQILTDYFVKCNKLEILSEKIRQAIAENPYFQAKSVFERFDKFRKGYLIPSDFSEFMLENQVYPTESELYLIFRDFDKARLGVITIDKFEEQILPKQNRKLKKEALLRHPYAVEGRLSLDLEYLIAKYMEDKIKNIKELNIYKDKLKILKTYSVQEAYTLLDEQKIGFIASTKQLDSFLRKNGKALPTEELSRIFRYFTFQTNKEITYEMFRDQLDPYALGFYPGYAQKVTEKKAQQYNFIEKKLNIDRERAINLEKEYELEYKIADLKDSNRRLNQILGEQEAEIALERRLRYPYF